MMVVAGYEGWPHSGFMCFSYFGNKDRLKFIKELYKTLIPYEKVECCVLLLSWRILYIHILRIMKGNI